MPSKDSIFHHVKRSLVRFKHNVNQNIIIKLSQILPKMTIQQKKTYQDLPVIVSKNLSITKDDDGKTIQNPPAKGVPFFSPEQQTAPGTGLSGPNDTLPKLFTPLRIRGIEMPNRIWVSPMCQYSAQEGFQSPWHFAHYGGMAMRGVSFIPYCMTLVCFCLTMFLGRSHDVGSHCCPGSRPNYP